MTDPIVDLPPQIRGTGPRGAITQRDLQAARMAAGSGPGNRPPVTLEPLDFPFGARGGPTLDVDRYSLNPLYDYVRQLPAGDGIQGEPPRMFGGGSRDLPLITASGLDPNLLCWIPWFARHAAAAADATTVYVMIEDAEFLDPTAIKSHHGGTAWQEYVSRVWKWATAPKPPDAMTEAEFEEWSIAIGWQSLPTNLGAPS
jgi:hypothetical protein